MSYIRLYIISIWHHVLNVCGRKWSIRFDSHLRSVVKIKILKHYKTRSPILITSCSHRYRYYMCNMKAATTSFGTLWVYVFKPFLSYSFHRCGVDPESDYPGDKYCGGEGHKAFDRMFGYEHLRNIDGLSHIFIKQFYKYETLPQCPDCGSNYLYCDRKKQICVSRDKKACDIPVVSN